MESLANLPLRGLALLALFLSESLTTAQIPGGTLDPLDVPKYAAPLVIPPAMPRTAKIRQRGGKNIDYYEIAVRQFEQQVLPPGMPTTTVWGYGSIRHPGTVAEGGSFNYPSFTIEAKYGSPVRVKWINELVDPWGQPLRHLLPVDQTLHWANPPGPRDDHGHAQHPYLGPVPMVVHVHGAKTTQESDGYPEAWYLPALADPYPAAFTSGTFYEPFRASSSLGHLWQPGSATFEYPNEQRATTLWYHDHTLGMTRQNVYAGPAGFYLLRGGPDDMTVGRLPGPAPAMGDPAGTRHYEIPIAIQDRSFDADGALFYPSHRAFFEGLEPDQLQIPFDPDPALGGPSDVAPSWNPEFFGNTIVVNGRTWPYFDVERRRYRLRLLNGCNSRFLILRFDHDVPFWQIGAEGGFLPEPVELEQLLLAPAERADVIVEFDRVPVGTEVRLLNLGPDEPFGGGVPGVDFEPADADTTGQVMLFRVGPRAGRDTSTLPEDLALPPLVPLGPEDRVRRVSLNELDSQTVLVSEDEEGNIVLDPDGEPFGPVAALLGTLTEDGEGVPLGWDDDITENPVVGATEVWEIHNFTADAHPIHIHLVQFQVVERESADGSTRGPEPWERGYKDTVIAYPDEITRVKARFDIAGLFVWHCHILEHEDNEMMRPFRVGD